MSEAIIGYARATDAVSLAESLAHIAVSSGASYDVTFDPDGTVRINLYPLEPKADAADPSA